MTLICYAYARICGIMQHVVRIWLLHGHGLTPGWGWCINCCAADQVHDGADNGPGISVGTSVFPNGTRVEVYDDSAKTWWLAQVYMQVFCWRLSSRINNWHDVACVGRTRYKQWRKCEMQVCGQALDNIFRVHKRWQTSWRKHHVVWRYMSPLPNSYMNKYWVTHKPDTIIWKIYRLQGSKSIKTAQWHKRSCAGTKKDTGEESVPDIFAWQSCGCHFW